MTRTVIHRDEALAATKRIAVDILNENADVDRIAIVDDIFSRLHMYIWLVSDSVSGSFEMRWISYEKRLLDHCGAFWSGERNFAVRGAQSSEEDEVLNHIEEIGVPIGERPRREKLLLVDRHRSRTSWFAKIVESRQSGVLTRVVAFYSFKGGMGRTTAAASYALHCARLGQRVAAVDLDLDAPGLGRLLSTDEDGQISPWGVADFLLEHRLQYSLREYCHVCARPELTGGAAIDVFPSAVINEDYLSKLSKIDFDIRELEDPRQHGIGVLLERIRSELSPDVIVVDCRAGLAPVAGLMLTGLADLYVVFSTASQQAMDGLERVVHRLGADRLARGMPQAECVLVHAMVPEHVEARQRAVSTFEAKAEDIFSGSYYEAQQEDENEIFWSIGDMSNHLAPHRPVVIPYTATLSDFRDIRDVMHVIQGAPYEELGSRIDERLRSLSSIERSSDENDEEAEV